MDYANVLFGIAFHTAPDYIHTHAHIFTWKENQFFCDNGWSALKDIDSYNYIPKDDNNKYMTMNDNCIMALSNDKWNISISNVFDGKQLNLSQLYPTFPIATLNFPYTYIYVKEFRSFVWWNALRITLFSISRRLSEFLFYSFSAMEFLNF